MINMITSLVVAGILTATTAEYITHLSKEADNASKSYVDAATTRFTEYNALIQRNLRQ